MKREYMEVDKSSNPLGKRLLILNMTENSGEVFMKIVRQKNNKIALVR
jgi:hypothetical protein